MILVRRRPGVAVLVAASVALALLATGYHAHGLPGERPDSSALDAHRALRASSTTCLACTLTHAKSAPSFACVGHSAPGPESRPVAVDSPTRLDGPCLRSNSSRAPPAHA